MYLASCGMVTSVGLNYPAAAAALRAGIAGFAEIPFCDKEGKPIIGAPVPLSVEGAVDSERLVQLLGPAIRECLGVTGLEHARQVPLILCLSDPQFPGRAASLESWLPSALQTRLGVHFHHHSTIIAEGRTGAFTALDRARTLLLQGGVIGCLIAGVDSYMNYDTIAAYEQRGRLRTENNPDGIIPGEAAAVILVTDSPPPASRSWPVVQIGRVGIAHEAALWDSQEPIVGEGLANAVRAALAASELDMIDIDLRISDLTGERYGFRETNYALARVLRGRKESLPLWHCMDSLGDTGAAAGTCMLARAAAAFAKHYGHGPNILCQSSAESGLRAAVVLKHLARAGH